MLLESINQILWGVPVLLLIISVGILFSVRTSFVQIRLFPCAWNVFLESFKQKNDSRVRVSGYSALCTALAATVGTGNIVGVTGAIAIGGPGVVFWMWICALLGMVIKLAEVSLSMKYREKDSCGNWIGGPMYTIKNGLSARYHFLAYIYAFCGIIASFGIGNATQVNAVIGSFQKIASYHNSSIRTIHCLLIGLILGCLMLISFRQGAAGIGQWAQRLVPVASLIYILITLLIILAQIDELPNVITRIIIGAFSPKTATCGIVTSAFISLRVGASRGVFTNEAGMGTASIAHAGSNIVNPISQGLLGSMEVFIDTIVMCTLTAFAVLCSCSKIPYGSDPGIDLTITSFSKILGPWCAYVITALMCVFAFATMLGWGLYGVRCAEFLFGSNAQKRLLVLQFIAVITGAMSTTRNVWLFSEIVNGLMVIPNLIALYLLFPVFKQQLLEYRKAYSQ